MAEVGRVSTGEAKPQRAQDPDKSRALQQRFATATRLFGLRISFGFRSSAFGLRPLLQFASLRAIRVTPFAVPALAGPLAPPPGFRIALAPQRLLRLRG